MMRNLRARSLLCLSLACSCVLSSSFASAAPPAKASGDDDAIVAVARERFKEGVSYFDQKQYDKARAAFLQAYALKKHPAVLLNLAQSELRSAHEADAAQHFAAYLRESKDASDSERQAAEAGLAAAKVAVAEVDVSVAERGAEVYVDGSLVGNSPLPGSVYVTPGSHTIEARKDGSSASLQINATAGKHFDAALQFTAKPAAKAAPAQAAAEEAPQEPPSMSPGRKPFFTWLVTSPVGLVGLGLTGVGLGGGIGFAVASKKDYNNADSIASRITDQAALDNTKYNMSRPLNTNGVCASPRSWLTQINYPTGDAAAFDFRASQYSDACNKYQKNVHDGDTMKTVATVGFVVAGVAAMGTVVYYFIDPSAKVQGESARGAARELALVPSLGPGERGLSLVGSF